MHQARIISRVSPAFLQQFLESFHNFAFLRTDGAGTPPPTCSKLLAQYVCCQAITDTTFLLLTQLLIHFLRVSRRNVTVKKSSITVFVSGVFFFFFFLVNKLLDSLR